MINFLYHLEFNSKSWVVSLNRNRIELFELRKKKNLSKVIKTYLDPLLVMVHLPHLVMTDGYAGARLQEVRVLNDDTSVFHHFVKYTNLAIDDLPPHY